MTGPAEGKIKLRGIVKLSDGESISILDGTDIYLHVRGYSLARVTHVDLENPILNELLPPKKSMYLPFIIRDAALEITFKTPRFIKSFNFKVRKLLVYSPILCSALGEGSSSYVYLGGKYEGIFLGFKKPFIERLEKLAIKLGVNPVKRNK